MSVVENLVKEYKDFKLDIPRMPLEDQGVTALWGASGSGKSSVVRHLIGLESCEKMRWIFQGQDLACMSIRDRRLGVVFQSLELFPHLSGEENILFAVKARKISSADYQTKIRLWKDLFELEKFWHRQIQQLSGGERQRIAVCRALIGSPRFLILDEPFSALDEGLRASARELLKTVLQKENVPTLLITHDQRDLEALASKVLHIHQGRLVTKDGSTQKPHAT